MKILFLGSGPFGLPALERLAALRDEVVVATVPPARRGRSPVPKPTVIGERAAELGLEVHLVESLKGDAGPRFLAETGAGLVITADFRLILGVPFLESPAAGCWNLHGSLLPRWRGAAPVPRAILAGDKTFGVSIYRMVARVDAGPVLAQVEWTPEAPADSASVEAHLASCAADLVETCLPAIESGDFKLEEQQEGASTKAPKLRKEEGWVDWRQPAEQIERQIRALHPWPRTFSRLIREQQEPERLFLISARADQEATPGASPGTVVGVADDGLLIACGSGQLLLGEAQREGKRPMQTGVLVRGFPIASGDRFQETGEGSGA